MENKKEDKWLVIVNPNSGSKKGAKDWLEISRYLAQNDISFDNVFTESKLHAIHISRDAVLRGYKKIVVVGGDGTINEVINGIFLQDKVPTNEVKIGMIPVGTGNDWGRMYGIPGNYKKAVEILKEEKLFIQDAGRITYQNKSQHTRYFVNMAGMGYDALVAKKTNIMKEKGRGGPLAYLINLFTGLIQYKLNYMQLTIDGCQKFSGKVFSMSVGICKYNGGGMMQLPNAVPDNGKFDITLVKEASKFKIVKKIKSLYDGSFVEFPEVETFVGEKIEIFAKPKNAVFLEADGESLGHTPITFEIIPKSVCLITGKTL